MFLSDPDSGRLKIHRCAQFHFEDGCPWPPLPAIPADITEPVRHKVAGVAQFPQMPAIAYCAPGFRGWGRMNQRLDRAFLAALMVMGAAYLILFGFYFSATMIRRPYWD